MNIMPIVDYLPAELKQGQIWRVVYYVKNPQTNKLARKVVKINRIKSITERRRYAKKLIAEINIKLISGWNPFIEASAPKGFYLLGEVINIFLNNKRNLRPHTIRSYKSYLKIFSEWLDFNQMNEIFVIGFNSAHAKKILNNNYNQKNISNTTYNNYLRFFKLFFEWCREEKYCANNPFQGMKTKKEATKGREIIPNLVRTKIRTYLINECEYMFLFVCNLAFHSLMRPGEIVKLKIGDIDFKNQTIFIPGENSKNGKARVSVIPDVMMRTIKYLDFENFEKTHYLITKNWVPGKTPIDSRNISKRWDTMRHRLNLPQSYKFYSLRDSGIVQKIVDGIPLNEIRDLADHSSIEITNKYIIYASPAASERIKRNATKF